MKRSVILIGGGGHSHVLADAALLLKMNVIGFVDPVKKEMRIGAKQIAWLGADKALENKKWLKKVFLINGIGSTGNTQKRRQLFERFRSMGYSFADIIHPCAIIAKDAQWGEGAQIMAGAVIQTGAQLGDNVLVNTRASVDHDCRIGSHVHIAPGAILCGGVRIGEGSHIGSGAIIIQGVSVGKDLLVRAGSLVKRTKRS